MYIVTGVSRGLGKAIAELLLSKNENVVGIGRNSSIIHSNFSFINCDFACPEQVSSLEISLPKEPITLINNAGVIGTIKRISDLQKLDLKEVLQINTVAPMELAKKIYAKVSDKNSFTLVNISSGAANRAIPSWAAYCASKSALNMLTETFYFEEKEKGFSPKVYAISPGVIDTDMQKQIRNSLENDFSAVKNFIALKNEGKLLSSDDAAIKLRHFLKSKRENSVFHDLRNI